MSKPNAEQPLPTPRPMVIVRGRGTPNERRIETSIMLYPVRHGGEIRWVTIPSR